MKPLLSAFLQRRRLLVVAPYVQGDILDLGCGPRPACELLTFGRRYVGVDRNPAFASTVRQRCPQAEFYLRNLDRDRLLLTGRFDTILMLAVVEHLEKPEFVLGQLPEYLAPGGWLLITTPTPLGHTVHRAGAAVGLFHQGAARDHKTIFTAEALGQGLERCGLQVVEYDRFLLSGNQRFICQVVSDPLLAIL